LTTCGKYAIIESEREGKTMKVKFPMAKVMVWFHVLNFGVVNQIITEPTDKWWLIELMVLIVSLYMSGERGEE
jgi:hypothetical protein